MIISAKKESTKFYSGKLLKGWQKCNYLLKKKGVIWSKRELYDIDFFFKKSFAEMKIA